MQIDQLKTDQLRTFRCVVENQTFSAAARTLFLSQPAVTLQIKKLEKTIGMPLFSKVRPTISLTPVGEALYRYSVQVANELSSYRRGHGGFPWACVYTANFRFVEIPASEVASTTSDREQERDGKPWCPETHACPSRVHALGP